MKVWRELGQRMWQGGRRCLSESEYDDFLVFFELHKDVVQNIGAIPNCFHFLYDMKFQAGLNMSLILIK